MDLDNDGTLEGTSPDYEIYGGLRVTSNTEFLYESVIFWHWAPTPCYGDATWEAEYALATEGLSLADYAELLSEKGFANMEELAAEIEALEYCKKIRDRRGGCKQRYSDLEHLYNIGVVTKNKANGGGTGGGGDASGSGAGLSGDPVVISGGISEGGITSGPNFETGRRTWIDILPQ